MPAELYGPFGALAALVAVLTMIVRGDLVPGWIYKSEQAQRERAEAREAVLLKATSTLTKIAANGSVGSGAPDGQ